MTIVIIGVKSGSRICTEAGTCSYDAAGSAARRKGARCILWRPKICVACTAATGW